MDGTDDCSVAVVIAAYQAEATIVAALQSVLAQTVAVRELMVIDDGSTDDTAPRAAAVSAVVSVHRLPANVGVGAALNEGIARTTAPVVMFLDADDLWAPRKVEVQSSALAATPDLDAVYGHSAQFVDAPDTSTVERVAAIASPAVVGVHKSAMAIRREALLRVGLFDPQFHRADLLEWLARPAARTLRTQVLPEVVHYRRLHAHNMGHEHRDEQRQQYADVMRAISRRRREGGAPT